MFTLGNKIATTIFLWSQCCYLTEETGKEAEANIRESQRRQLPANWAFSSACPLAALRTEPYTQPRTE